MTLQLTTKAAPTKAGCTDSQGDVAEPYLLVLKQVPQQENA